MCVRNVLLLLLKERDMHNLLKVREHCKKMNACMMSVIEIMASYSDLCLQNRDLKNGKMVVCEMEDIEETYNSAYGAGLSYLEANKDKRALAPASKLHQSVHHRSEVNTIRPNFYLIHYQMKHLMFKQYLNDRQQEQQQEVQSITNSPALSHSEQLDTQTAPLKSNVPQNISESSTGSSGTISKGQDLWHLKLVQIPVFSRDKRTYQSWKAAFVACIDNAPATGGYKLQLRQYLAGDALKAIENLGHSTVAYEAAKERWSESMEAEEDKLL